MLELDTKMSTSYEETIRSITAGNMRADAAVLAARIATGTIGYEMLEIIAGMPSDDTALRLLLADLPPIEPPAEETKS